MRPFHLGVDLDDVCLDLTGEEGIRRVLYTEYGVKVPPFDKWEIDDVLRPILGKSWMSWMRERDWLWSTFPAIPGAIGTLEDLRRAGFYIEIVTSKPKWAEASVWDWLAKWRLPAQRVTIVGPDDRKVDLTRADLLVDDKIANCEEFIRAGRQAMLFSRSHNLTQVHDARILRVDGWLEIRKRLLG